MKPKLCGMLILGIGVFFVALVHADDPTSKIVHLQPLASKLLANSSENAVQLEVWDKPGGGTNIYSEPHNVDTDSSSNITNDTNFPDLLLGRCTPQPCTGGLDPSKFPQGSSRYLDVTQGGVSVLLGGFRIPMYAAVFSLTPGPQGPAGPAGGQGPQGPPGPISNVVAGTGLTGGGGTPTVTLAIASGGVGTPQLATNAVTSPNIATPLVLTASIVPGTTFSAFNTATGKGAWGIHGVGGAMGVVGSSSIGVGISGDTDQGTGVLGTSNTSQGVVGVSQNGGIGVSGIGSDTNGTGVTGSGRIGGFFQSANGMGVQARGATRGLYANSTTANGFGVLADGFIGVRGDGDAFYGAQNIGVMGNGNTGVVGNGNSTGVVGNGNTGMVGNGTGGGSLGMSGTGFFGVKGTATAGDFGVGVFGVSDSGTNAVGVRGDSASGTGVAGLSASTNGIGVVGLSTSDSGTGVSGSGHFGVFGNSTGNSSSGAGVFGLSTNAARPAVVGINTVPGVGFAGIFSGNVFVGGIFAASVKAFKIDHPLDPGRKYLSHSSVESPDMKNVYDGVVTLQADGQAWVELPAYFEALNKDFRYQLTSIGAPAPNLYIAQEVSGNRFQIAGGQPGGKVSWQVTGIRHDPFAEQQRILVEEEKPADERDYYLHPEVYGQPESKGIVALRAPLPSKTSLDNSGHP